MILEKVNGVSKKINYVDWGFVDAKGTGLDIDFETGQIYGTPSCEAGSYDCRVKVWTNYGEAEGIVTVKVNNNPVGKSAFIGVENIKTDSSETVYIPLSLLGWRHVYPSEGVTISSKTFYLENNKTTYTNFYSTDFVRVAIDNSTCNLMITRHAKTLGKFSNTNTNILRFKLTIKTNKGTSQSLPLCLYTDSSDIRVGDFNYTDHSTSAKMIANSDYVDTLTSYNYRTNEIY